MGGQRRASANLGARPSSRSPGGIRVLAAAELAITLAMPRACIRVDAAVAGATVRLILREATAQC